MPAFGWPYQDSPLPGYWGKVNSKFNFCEEDYMVTSYVAELINALTSLVYVVWGLHGILENRGRKDAFLRNLPNLGAMSVGIGSLIFHMSMKNYTQWCDDLSMLLASGLILYRVYTFDKSSQSSVMIGVGITSVLTAFSIWHCYVDETEMHSLLFGIIMVAIAAKSRSLIQSRISNLAVKQDVARLNIWGAVIFLVGYGIWNLDYAFCDSLTSLRRAIGMPWSFLFELHGWWHIFTAIGGYVSPQYLQPLNNFVPKTLIFPYAEDTYGLSIPSLAVLALPRPRNNQDWIEEARPYRPPERRTCRYP